MRTHQQSQSRYEALRQLLEDRNVSAESHSYVIAAVAVWGSLDSVHDAVRFDNKDHVLLLFGEDGRFELVVWEPENEDFPPNVKNLQIEAFGSQSIRSVTVTPDLRTSRGLTIRASVIGVHSDQPTAEIKVGFKRSIAGRDELVYTVAPYADERDVAAVLRLGRFIDTD